MLYIVNSVPGYKDVVVAHELEYLQRRYQAPDMRNAINEAFRIAECQLGKVKGKLTDHGAEPQHESANAFRGQIAEVMPGEDHGFLFNEEGGLLCFHRNSMLGGDFDAFQCGDNVSYVEEVGDTGPIATKVRVE